MKILQVINCFIRGGGAEKFLFDLVLEQKKEGHEVEILSIVAPTENNREFIELVVGKGIPVYTLSDGSIYAWKNIRKIHCFFRSHRYDVVNVHLFPALYFCALAKSKDLKLVYTEHSTDNRRRHFRLFTQMDRWIYSRYEQVICISERVKESLCKKVGMFPVTVIPNGIVFSDFYTATTYNRKKLDIDIPETIKLITMCARFCKAKDYLTLFRALELLPENVHVLCVGTGELLADHQRYCQEKGLARRVHFLGLRKDVNYIFKVSDVIVLSSVYEGFSLSMLEAMASGKPFIASKVPGIVDLIEGYALLFPFGDENILAASIRKLLSDQEYCKMIVAKSLEFAKKYDIVSTAMQYVELYNKLK